MAKVSSSTPVRVRCPQPPQASSPAAPGPGRRPDAPRPRSSSCDDACCSSSGWPAATAAAAAAAATTTTAASTVTSPPGFHVCLATAALVLLVLAPLSAVDAAAGGLGGAARPFRFTQRAAPAAASAAAAAAAQALRDQSALNKLRAASAITTKKRSFVELQCRGMYDQGILTQLERICEDCYNLYKDAEVHGYCRMDCFSTTTFRQCLQSLLLEKEYDFYMELVEIVGKKKR